MKCERLYGGGFGGSGGSGGMNNINALGGGGTLSGGSLDGRIVGIIAGYVVGSVIFICCVVFCAWSRCCILKGWPLRSNNSYINSGTAIQYDMSESVFISSTFASYYHQYLMHHGPHDMTLAFYPEADCIVKGGGTDNVGTYVITGVYSPRTLRMGLKKSYQKGTGDQSKNFGHTVTIQVEWKSESQQFEGKYYVRTRKHGDANQFIIQFQDANKYRPYTIQSFV